MMGTKTHEYVTSPLRPLTRGVVLAVISGFVIFVIGPAAINRLLVCAEFLPR